LKSRVAAISRRGDKLLRLHIFCRFRSAARPLDVGVRDSFLQSVADALARCDIIGPGTIHRIVMEKQRQFFDPQRARQSAPALSALTRFGVKLFEKSAQL
jgi:hypothetical protein